MLKCQLHAGNTRALRFQQIERCGAIGTQRRRSVPLNKPVTQVHRFKKNTNFPSSYCSGASLHNHTMHSKERLNRLPAYIAKFPIGGYLIERELGRLHLYKAWNFDFNKYYWTPLSPREAHELESTVIEKDLGLKPLVSLSDHDNIEASLHLRMLGPTRDVPISVEWTVP